LDNYPVLEWILFPQTVFFPTATRDSWTQNLKYHQDAMGNCFTVSVHRCFLTDTYLISYFHITDNTVQNNHCQTLMKLDINN